MRWEDFRVSENVEDRRGGGGIGLPGGAGGLGIGTMIILGLLGWVLGIDPRILIGGAETITRGGGGVTNSARRKESRACRRTKPAASPQRSSATLRMSGRRFFRP